MAHAIICIKCQNEWKPKYIVDDGMTYEFDICEDCWRKEMAEYLGEDTE